jgi:hypothetical protein
MLVLLSVLLLATGATAQRENVTFSWYGVTW